MGRNSKYYGIRFDRRSQNFGFHMIARSQLIADDRKRSQKTEHGSNFCDRLRSRSQDRKWSQKRVSIWSQTIAELFAICDPRSAIVCDHMETSLKSSSKRKIKDIESSSSEEYEFEEAKRAEGYRFVDMGSLEDLIERVLAFSGNCSG